MEGLGKNSSWKINNLLWTWLIITLAVISWFVPPTKQLWDLIDEKLFYFFNSFVHTSKIAQNTWAFLNSHIADWLYDVVMAAFVFTYIFKAKGEERKKRAIQVVFLTLFTVFCFLYCNRVFFGKIIHPRRISPAGVLPDFFHLSHVITWVKVKEIGTGCFPADHGCTICMFIVGIFHLAGYRGGLLAFLVSLPFMLPRLITGAHWITDIALGSLPMALFNLSWIFYTPIMSQVTEKSLKLFRKENAQKFFRKNLRQSS